MSESWWGVRWEIVQRGGEIRGARIWAAGEIASAALSAATLALAIAILAFSRFVAFPPWLTGWPLQILLAAAVGYGTNFLAVQMLFKPRRPLDWFPMRWIWRQGLIPARQGELARVVGTEVAARLLTPEAIVDELGRLIEAALDDPGLVDRAAEGLRPVLEEQVPRLLRRVAPETAEALSAFLEKHVSAEDFRRVAGNLIDDWFSHEENREVIADFLLAFLAEHSEVLIDIIRRAVKRYRKGGALRSFGIGLSEATAILDWEEFGHTLREQFGKPKSRRWAIHLLADLATKIRGLFDRIVETQWLDDLRRRVGDFALTSMDEIAETELVPRLVSHLRAESFREYLASELFPRAKPAVRDWIGKGYLTPFFERFDVEGRVSRSAASLDVTELEEMANRVAATHLGAIQVLGYVLGAAAGVLMVLVA